MKKKSYFDKVIIRTPFKAMNHCYEYYSNPLESISNDPTLMQAIEIASPSLYHDLCNYSSLSNKKQSKSKEALVRYLVRSATRCTPFGLFAGVSVVPLGDLETHVLLTDPYINPYLDMNGLLKISEHFLNLKEIKENILLYLNTTLYDLNNEYKYIDYIFEGENIKYNISSIKRTNLINKICTYSASGATREYLVSSIQNIGNIARNDADSLVQDLVNYHILIPELSVNLIGTPYLDRIIRFLQCKNLKSESTSQLEFLYSQITDISQNRNYRKSLIFDIKKVFDSLVGDRHKTNSNLLCIDLYNAVSKNSYIGHRVLTELEHTVTFLSRLASVDYNANLERFKEIFENVYGDNEVQLCNVLDPEVGIGYPALSTDMINGIEFQSDFYLPPNNTEVKFTQFEKLILEKISEKYTNDEIELLDDDIQFTKENGCHHTSTISTLFEIIADNQKETNIRIIAIGDYFSCNLIARFAKNNNEIEQICRRLNNFNNDNKDHDPSKVYAQIVHMPKVRAGNVICHSNLNDYEIPIGAYSSLDTEKIINYRDLLISIHNNRIILRSSVLDKEILPILNNAYDFSTSCVPLYRFLCDLQGQNRLSFPNLSIPNLRNTLRHIPRIRYRHSVLVPSTWRVQSKKFNPQNNNDDNDESLLSRFSEIFEKNGIPRSVYIEEGDNRLYLDITSVSSIRASLSVIRRNTDVFFSEVLYNERTAVIRDKEGNGYVNECIAFFNK